MFDIHSHILPMIDDGATSVDMALEMLDQAYRSGTEDIVLTPHFAKAYKYNNPKNKVKSLFLDLKNIVQQEGIPIQLYLGTEYLFSSVESFYEDLELIQTMNDTQYLLMEFFFDTDSEFVKEAAEAVLKKHMIPIIAHPERFECIQTSYRLVEDLLKQGVLFQLNKGSVLGEYGNRVKETALELLEHHVYSFVGSDAHRSYRRNSRMEETYDFIRYYFGKQYTESIFYINPANMLRGMDIRKGHYEEY